MAEPERPKGQEELDVDHPTERRPEISTRVENRSTGVGGAALGFGAVALMVLCCARPVILAAGALGSVGAFLGNPLVILVSFFLAAGAVVNVARRRSKSATCCPPGDVAPLSAARPEE